MPGSVGKKPLMAGATRAMTFLPLAMARTTCATWLLCMMAAKGQALMHLPQRMHFSWSTVTRPSSVLPMAPTGQASAQARGTWMMAW